MNDTFLIITANKYPEGDAGAVRQHSFAKIFQTLGFKPIVIGIGSSTGFKKSTYDGVVFYSVRYAFKNVFFRFLGRLLFAYHVKKIIARIHPGTIKGILVVSGGNCLFRDIEKFCISNEIPLYHDSVEWYSASEFKKGEKDRAYIANDTLNTCVINESYKVFAISRFLSDYFSSRKIPSLRVPVIMDLDRIKYDKIEPEGAIKIVYAGAVGGKDNLVEVVKAIECLDRNISENIQFFIIGISQEQYENAFGKVKKDLINRSIFFVGRVPRASVFDYLKKADFTILLRPEQERYAKAGFPTKVVESLASGTPVICNFTSDLNLYLKDGYNSVIVDSCSRDACADALRRVVKLSLEERLKMRCSARKTAEENFNWKLYVEPISKFI